MQPLLALSRFATSRRPASARAPSELKADFWKALRKRETPYAFMLDAGPAGRSPGGCSWAPIRAPPISSPSISGRCPPFTRRASWRRAASRRIWSRSSAHCLSSSSSGCFSIGHFGLGPGAAWLMTFLDTVDGKLARTTLTSSKWGDILDHGIDLIHPPFWYVAWAWALASRACVDGRDLLDGHHRHSRRLCSSAGHGGHRHQMAGS